MFAHSCSLQYYLINDGREVGATQKSIDRRLGKEIWYIGTQSICDTLCHMLQHGWTLGTSGMNQSHTHTKTNTMILLMFGI